MTGWKKNAKFDQNAANPSIFIHSVYIFLKTGCSIYHWKFKSQKIMTHYIYPYTECPKNVPDFRYVPLRLREQEHTEERQQELGKVILAHRQAKRGTKNMMKKCMLSLIKKIIIWIKAYLTMLSIWNFITVKTINMAVNPYAKFRKTYWKFHKNPSMYTTIAHFSTY